MAGDISPNGPIVLTGGTGNLGRRLLARLRDVGHAVRVLSRTDHIDEKGVEYVKGDLATGQGIGNALSGSEIVVHCAGSAKGDDEKALNLINAARAEAVGHIVYISVVGADKIPISSAIDQAMFGYYKAKFDAERIIADSGIPWTTLRATQFHDLIMTSVRGIARMPIAPVPKGFRFQPIDASEVADRLVELALGSPAGLVPSMGGPHVYQMSDLLHSYLRAVGKRRWVVPMGIPGKAAEVMRAGANLDESRAIGTRTWEDFLASEIAS